MPRAQPWQQRSATPRAVVMSVTLAIAAHAGAFAWLSTRGVSAGAANPPSVEGSGESGVGGLPVKTRRNLHEFRLVDKEADDAPVAGARVYDVLGDQEAVTREDGVAVLTVRVAAKLLVRIEKPGFAVHAEQFGNADATFARHTIHLTRADVPYANVDTIFIQRCVYCHGGAGRTEGVDLTTYERVMASRWRSAPIVVPGKPAASNLVRVLTDSVGPDGRRTPHARVTARVPEFELETITVWVRQGARRTTPP